MTRRPALPVAVLLLPAIAAALLAADDPFSGVWRLNIAKSKIAPPVPRSHTSTIDADAEGVRVREEIVNENGEQVTVTFEAKFDGKDYPVTGSVLADTVAFRRIDPHTITAVVKKGGKVVLSETEAVSKDGKILSGTYSATDASGKTITGVAVLEKQP